MRFQCTQIQLNQQLVSYKYFGLWSYGSFSTVSKSYVLLLIIIILMWYSRLVSREYWHIMGLKPGWWRKQICKVWRGRNGWWWDECAGPHIWLVIRAWGPQKFDRGPGAATQAARWVATQLISRLTIDVCFCFREFGGPSISAFCYTIIFALQVDSVQIWWAFISPHIIN